MPAHCKPTDDQAQTVRIDGHKLAVMSKGDDVMIFMPGVFEMTIDRLSAAALAKAIYAKAMRMSIEEAEDFCGGFARQQEH